VQSKSNFLEMRKLLSTKFAKSAHFLIFLCIKRLFFQLVRIAIFASGNGSNAENIIRYFKNHPSIEVGVVVSNNPHAYVHERAKAFGIESFSFSKSEFEKGCSVLELLRRYNIDFIVLAGFMLKIPPLLLDAFPYKIVEYSSGSFAEARWKRYVRRSGAPGRDRIG